MTSSENRKSDNAIARAAPPETLPRKRRHIYHSIAHNVQRATTLAKITFEYVIEIYDGGKLFKKRKQKAS
jgi:hypothetical protein